MSSTTIADTGLQDRLEISELICAERLWRDLGYWDKVAGAFLPDAHVRTTWFEGTASEYIAASQDDAKQGRRSQHPFVPAEIRVNGDRATSESVAEILTRELLDGIEVDMTMRCRFFSRLVRTGEGWRIASFEGIYIKDRFDAVFPGDEIPIDWARLRSYRDAYRSLCYCMELQGYTVSQELLGDDRPDLLERFYAEADAWLQGGSR
jgi:hypothetical protein